jgi:hypothetical protein
LLALFGHARDFQIAPAFGARAASWVSILPRAACGAKRPFAKTLMSALCRFCCESLFGVVNDKFLEALMRFTLGDVRDHIVSSKIDHGPPW